ncbi:uncharacterized protein [Diadema setosum]|uniref:uncharacterized protein n=1 Tax=Diadema setosum TaxID=31175 RepID=UPI003B3A750E
MASSGEERIAGQVRIFNKYTFMCTGYGLASSLVYNGLMKVPLVSGGHRHIIASLVGGVLGYYIAKLESRRVAEKEFYIQEYIKRNPDDFKKGEPKKLAEITRLWLPVR